MGSTRVSRVRPGVPPGGERPHASQVSWPFVTATRTFGETPKATRGTGVLPVGPAGSVDTLVRRLALGFSVSRRRSGRAGTGAKRT